MITERVAREKLDSESSQLRWLQSWWSKTYNKPLKDPLLNEYTIEELYYEFRLSIERDKASVEKQEEDSDKIEDKKLDDANAWADAEEAKDNESTDTKSGHTAEDKKWMDEQMRLAKAQYGDDFGEDIQEDFE